MKKIILLIICVVSFEFSYACADYDPEYEYYNLFMQELISDPQYYPFLLTYGSGFYTTADSTQLQNENIKEWQQYLGISYVDSRYLVFKAKRIDLQKLTQGIPTTDPQLSFANANFVKRHGQALRYLAYAKYLEPYMTIYFADADKWSYQPDTTVANLNYSQVEKVLLKSWKVETDQELKLRYGYQLVRLAHYSRRYQTAIRYFDKYVESIGYRPVFYYYALDQKAGAEKGLKLFDIANYNFLQVFSHSIDLKQSAFLSIKFAKRPDIFDLLKRTCTTEEKNNVYLLLGYSQFNNPLSSIRQITKNTPDAIQAKVLMARAINSIERSYVLTGIYSEIFTKPTGVVDKRYPITSGLKSDVFFKNLCDFSKSMACDKRVVDKNFWNFTSAYLCFLKKDFASAKKFLGQVCDVNRLYRNQKKNLAMYIDICEQPIINSTVEQTLFSRYKSSFEREKNVSDWRTDNFIDDVLANRYYLQKDYAKSFLMNNDLKAMESNPNMQLLDALEAFYKKSDKNDFEKMLLGGMQKSLEGDCRRANTMDIQSYLFNIRGTVQLSEGDFEAALQSFKFVQLGFKQFDLSKDTVNNNWYYRPKTNFDGFSGISSRIFGYNILEHFGCSEDTVMCKDFIAEYPFIKKSMNKTELTEALILMKKKATGTGDDAAKAGFLLANFIYNTTSNGYYRNILRFDQDNAYCEKYRNFEKCDLFNNIYLKYYSFHTFYNNNLTLSQLYLEKAYLQTENAAIKARIAFVLSKCEQDHHYMQLSSDSFYWIESKDILIKDRKYFKELRKYNQTAFYKDLESNCLYFRYYTTHY